jgi:hypothetical protein
MNSLVRNDIIYSIEISLDKDVEPSWISYMKTHIEEVVNSVCFRDFSIHKVITDEFDDNLKMIDSSVVKYVIGYRANNKNHLKEYLENFSKGLQKDHNSKFEGKFIAKRKILEDQFKEWYQKGDLDKNIKWSDSKVLKWENTSSFY